MHAGSQAHSDRHHAPSAGRRLDEWRLKLTAKDIRFEDDARARMMAGVDKLANAVCVTMGPRGRNVILEQGHAAPRSTKDGVTVAHEMELEDRFENVGAQLIRQVAEKANDEAGDGTTTAIVLARAIVREGMKAVAVGLDPAGVRKGVDMAIAAADAHVARISRAVETREDIVNVGLVASNGDAHCAELLAEALDRVGRDGAISVEVSQSRETELDVEEGLQFDTGYVSPQFVTDADTSVCALDQPKILLHLGKVNSLRALMPILEETARDGAPLLIVADDFDDEVLATLIVNKVRGKMKLAAVKAPAFGEQRKAVLGDIAALTGAAVIGDETGNTLERAGGADMGRARRVVIDKETTIISGSGGRETEIEARAQQIRREIGTTESESDRGHLEQRLAALSGGVAVIRIGGESKAEAAERRDRIEDALCAVRVAADGGVVAGGGAALLNAAASLDALNPRNDAERAGVNAVRRALEAPLLQIGRNAGLEGPFIAGKLRERNDAHFGLDARTGDIVDMVAHGVIDPAPVVRAALHAGGSVANAMMMTEAIIAEHVENDEHEEPFAAAE